MHALQSLRSVSQRKENTLAHSLIAELQAKQVQVSLLPHMPLCLSSLFVYRHTYGQAAKKENTYDNIKISASA